MSARAEGVAEVSADVHTKAWVGTRRDSEAMRIVRLNHSHKEQVSPSSVLICISQIILVILPTQMGAVSRAAKWG